MEKVIYGKVTMYRHKCPLCQLDILSNGRDYECDCGYRSKDKKIKRTTIEVTTGRQKISAKLKKGLNKKQMGDCYWCGRRFGAMYYKNNSVKTLRRHYDHKIPYVYEQRNRDDNWCVACNICNLFKSSLLFETEEDCVEYLTKRWNNSIKIGKIDIITE